MRSLPALLVAALLASSCATTPAHFASPPSAAAAVDVREAFYEQHAPTGIRVQPPAAAMARGGRPPVTSSFIVLQNGTRVDEAVQLLPLVKPSSPTARAAESAAEHRERARSWWTVAAVTVITGSLLQLTSTFAGLLSYPPVEGGGAGRDPALYMLGNVGALALLGAGGGAALASLHEAEHARRDEVTALLAFDMSLRDRLGLERRRASAVTVTADSE